MVRLSSAFLSLCLGGLTVVHGAYCNGSPDPDAPPNLHQLGNDPPVLLRTIENAELYVYNANTTFQFQVCHTCLSVSVWRTAFTLPLNHCSP